MVRILPDKFPIGWQGQKNRKAGYFMDRNLYLNLLHSKKAIKKDWDMFNVVDGGEGTGKSVFTQQLATFCDPTFDVSRIAFRPKEFKEAILNAKKFQAIIFDEAYGGLASRKAMSATNHTLIDMMAEIRQRNLFVFIVLPSFFELDKYAAIHRTRLLFHVYQNKFQRGFFRVYTGKQKKLMYLLGKKTYNYNCVKSAFHGHFPDFYTVNKQEYIKKKGESLRSMSDDEDDNTGVKKHPSHVKLEKCMFELLIGTTRKDRLAVAMKAGVSKTFLDGFYYRYMEDINAKEQVEGKLKASAFKLPN